MKKNRLLILVIVGVAFLGVAEYLFWPGGKVDVSETDVVSETFEGEGAYELSTETASVFESQTDVLPPQNTAPQLDLPTPRIELMSTDPGSVTLASGGIQLVELFAFW